MAIFNLGKVGELKAGGFWAACLGDILQDRGVKAPGRKGHVWSQTGLGLDGVVCRLTGQGC